MTVHFRQQLFQKQGKHEKKRQKCKIKTIVLINQYFIFNNTHLNKYVKYQNIAHDFNTKQIEYLQL